MKINGIDKVVAKLKKLPLDIQQEIKEVTKDTAEEIKADAFDNLRKNIPHNPGEMIYEASVIIGTSIEAGHSHEGLVGYVHVNAGKMAAYIEFGTGLSAAQYVPTLPPYWQKIAREFYINGKGTIKAAPYLYPAYFKHSKDFAEKIKQAVKRGLGK